MVSRPGILSLGCKIAAITAVAHITATIKNSWAVRNMERQTDYEIINQKLDAIVNDALNALEVERLEDEKQDDIEEFERIKAKYGL